MSVRAAFEVAPLERYYKDAVSESEIIVCRLRAPIPVLQERVRQREIGSALEWHLARAVELAEHFERSAVADLVVDTAGRHVREIALEVLTRIRWLEVIQNSRRDDV